MVTQLQQVHEQCLAIIEYRGTELAESGKLHPFTSKS
jgi:hypothetical protein